MLGVVRGRACQARCGGDGVGVEAGLGIQVSARQWRAHKPRAAVLLAPAACAINAAQDHLLLCIGADLHPAHTNTLQHLLPQPLESSFNINLFDLSSRLAVSHALAVMAEIMEEGRLGIRTSVWSWLMPAHWSIQLTKAE